MLATLGRVPFDDPAWICEPKWDGFRVIALIREGSVQLLSRNLHLFTNLFRPITQALRDFPASLVLDGEVVAIGKNGLPDFETLQGWLHPQKARLAEQLAYIVFDCLYVNGHSLLTHILDDRQRVLRELTHALRTDEIRVSEPFPGEEGTLVFKAAAGMAIEGVIAKHKESVYRPGMRSRDWVKIPIPAAGRVRGRRVLRPEPQSPQNPDCGSIRPR